MAFGVLRPSLTFGMAFVSAMVFLILRCQGEGRPFSRPARWWALATVAFTSVVSTVVALLTVSVMRHVPAALVGVVAPSGLCLGRLRRMPPESRRSRLQEAPSLGLSWLLDRLHQAMAEDRLLWCEKRVDPMWRAEQLQAAARHYHAYLRERLPLQERRRGRINARLRAIEDRLDIVLLIEHGSSVTKVRSELRASRVTKEQRYERYRDDLTRLADLLRHDAERDLIRLLGAGYRNGCYRLRPFGAAVPEPAIAAPRPQRPHP